VTRGQLLPVGRMESGAGPMYGAGGPVAQSLAGSMGSPQAQMPVVVPPPLGADVKRGVLWPVAHTESGRMRPAVPWVALNIWDAIQTANRYASGKVPFADRDVKDVAQVALELAGTGYTKGLLSGLPPIGTFAQSSWHGGPNKWLPDATGRVGPSLEKVGTGEGAQAYGWGFYSADKKGVANEYFTKLSQRKFDALTPDEQALVPNWVTNKIRQGDPESGVNESILEFTRRMQDDMDALKDPDVMQPWLIEVRIDGHRKRIAALEKLEAGKDFGSTETGQLYHLDLPDEDVAKYLDWDAPLSEQPANVRAALAKLADMDLGQAPHSGYNKVFFEKLRSRLRGEDIPYSDGTQSDGGLLYKSLKVAFADDSGKKISEALRRAGIPGLKYFDAKSRPITGQPTAQGTAASLLDAAGGDVDAAIALAHKRISQGNIPADQPVKGGLRDAIEVLKQYGEPRTRNYVTWDQDVLDRVKILEQP
jgi:hypothetical protein